jgi:site-specific DNA recombinase
MRAAAYLRVSTEEQAGEGKESLSAQLRDIQAHCQRQGYQLIEPEYRDTQSGADLKKERVAFTRLLNDLREFKDKPDRRIDVVVVWKHDRAFRNLRPLVDLRDALYDTGATIEAVIGHMDLPYLGLMASVAEIELNRIKDRIRMGMRGRARRGSFPCPAAPFGYRYVPGTGQVEIVEEEATVVRRIYEMYVEEGFSIRGIALKLNEEGLPTREGGASGWLPTGVNRILTSSTYKGEFQWGRRPIQPNGRARRLKPEELEKNPDAIIRVPVPAIVTEDVWEKARAKAERNYGHSKKQEDSATLFYLLRGLLYCDECRRPFKSVGIPAGRRRYDKRGDRWWTTATEWRGYGCRGMDQHRLECRNPKYLRAELIEGPVWNVVQRAFTDPLYLQLAHDARLAQLAGENAEGAALIAKRRTQIARAEQERQRAISLCTQDLITEADLREQLSRLDQQLREWQAELDEGVKEADWRVHAEQITRHLEDFVRNGPPFDDMTDQERREFLLTVIDRVWVDGTGEIRIEGIVRFPKVNAHNCTQGGCGRCPLS